MWFVDWLDCNIRALGIWLGLDTYTAVKTFCQKLLGLLTIVAIVMLCYYIIGGIKDENHSGSDRRNRNYDAETGLLQFQQSPGASLVDTLHLSSSLRS